MIQIKLDKKAKGVIAKTADFSGEGGTIVVDKLPKVGDEHTIYELREKKVITFLVTMNNQQMADDGIQYGNASRTFVFKTTKEMQGTFTSIIPEGPSDTYLNYITEEDKLIGAVYAHDEWHFTEARKVSNCKFDISNIYVMEDPEYVVILKEYLGIPEVEEEAWYTGRLWNDELYVFEKRVSGILLGTPAIGDMDFGECMEELSEIPEEAPKEYIFENIPYEKIINYQLFDGGGWLFTPKSKEITESSYWIYTNNEWVNIDEIDIEPSLHKTVFGKLTDTGDQTQLQCSLTLEEMANAIAEGNCVVLELYLGDESEGNYWYCAITEVTGMEAPQPTISTTWGLAYGYIYWNNRTGAFGFDNGVM